MQKFISSTPVYWTFGSQYNELTIGKTKQYTCCRFFYLPSKHILIQSTCFVPNIKPHIKCAKKYTTHLIQRPQTILSENSQIMFTILQFELAFSNS